MAGSVRRALSAPRDRWPGAMVPIGLFVQRLAHVGAELVDDLPAPVDRSAHPEEAVDHALFPADIGGGTRPPPPGAPGPPPLPPPGAPPGGEYVPPGEPPRC